MLDETVLRGAVCGAVVAVALLAAYYDWRWRRIPNWLTYPAAAVAIGVRLLLGGAGAATQGAVGLAIAFVIMAALFAGGIMGGGDVKLAAALGGWIGWQAIPRALFYMALLGAGLSLAMVAAAHRARSMDGARDDEELAKVERRRMTVPYGVAIAGGAVLALVL
ncbi:MAG: prepilin peptidase [Calditrichaeota bacterium]|nr:prepilin peptidase [Calditrichota bacterium]